MYAAKTSVTVDKSRAEIEKILRRYGADQFLSGWESSRAMISFRAKGRSLRIVLTLPSKDDKKFTHVRPWQRRTIAASAALWEKAVRQRWRALALVVKAKLESVESGIETFDEAWMPWIILPDGRTTAEFMSPQIEEAYRSGVMPPMLRQLGAGDKP